MRLSELSNRELKGILRENQVKNYSNLNKKELVKKVNQLTREQNGGKSGKGKNGKKKKYTLKDLIGGSPPGIPTIENPVNLPNIKNTTYPSPPPPPPPPFKNQAPSNIQPATASLQNSARSNIQPVIGSSQNSAPSNIQPATASLQNSAPSNSKVATAPHFNNNQIKHQENREFNRQTNEAKRASLVTQPPNKLSNQGNNTKKNNECGACSIQ
jgi:hypothetical protein